MPTFPGPSVSDWVCLTRRPYLDRAERWVRSRTAAEPYDDELDEPAPLGPAQIAEQTIKLLMADEYPETS
jgi:hypothetical protein